MEQDWKQRLVRLQADPRYLENLDWGKARRGHPEGTIRAHIAELERNLERLQIEYGQAEVSQLDVQKLRFLIHVHDTFKPNATAGVNIEHPQSHASLAAAFVRELLQAESEPPAADALDVVAMVQNHDVGYALWRKASHRKVDGTDARFQQLLASIDDGRLFSAFLIIDNCTSGKTRVPVAWFLELVADFKPEVIHWRSCSMLGLPDRAEPR